MNFVSVKNLCRSLLLSAAVVVGLLAFGCGGGDDNPSGGGGRSNNCGKDGTDGSCKKVTIGTQTWMAENLNYTPSTGNSWCYGNDNADCDKYGRLYDWNTARTVCPTGWHLPTGQEWEKLLVYAGGSLDVTGGSLTAGGKLKAKSFNGTDDYGFSAMPGGSRLDGGSFKWGGESGYWWTATGQGDIGSGRWMGYDNNYVHVENTNKSKGYSVRCVQ